jgi:hypothetical protein
LTRFVLLISVAQWNNSGFPTSAIITAEESTIRVNILMVRIGFPLRRLSPTCDDNAGPILGFASSDLHGSSKMHEKTNRA